MPSTINSDNGVSSGTSGLKSSGGNDGILTFQSSGTETMRIDASGNLLLNTSGSTYSYQAKNFVIADATSAGITVTNLSQILTLTAGYGATFVGAKSNHSLILTTNDIERARIDSSGNLLVGTTSSTNAGRITAASDSAGSAYPVYVNNTNTGSTSQIVIDIARNGTRVGSISNTNTTTTYATSSDYRLKENVQPMTGALARVAALKPVTYKWKADGSDGEGFIAHELAEVCPQAVSGEKDAVNEDGSINPQGIDTSFLVATLTAAIQELKAELDTVKTELTALKGA